MLAKNVNMYAIVGCSALHINAYTICSKENVCMFYHTIANVILCDAVCCVGGVAYR